MSSVTETTGGDLREGGRRTPWMLIGGGVAGAVLIGGGVVAATQLLSGGGDQPDSVLPATAAAYAQVDLDPEAAQKITAVRFFQGLDSTTKQELDKDWRKWVWDKLEEEGDAPSGVDFEKDIEPWLGDRAGIAVMPAGEGEEPTVAVALQVKDGKAALAFLDEQAKDDEQVAYYLDDDYVVFTAKETLEAVKSAAEQQALADNETYSQDMDDVGDLGVVSMWGDAAQLDDINPTTFNPAIDATQSELGVTAPEVKGRFAGTVRFTPDAIEMHAIGRGAEGVPLAEPADSPRLVNDLPADTVAALSMEQGDDMVQAAWDYYANLFPEELEEAKTQAAEQGFTLPDDIKTAVGDSMVLSVGPGIVEAVESIGATDASVPEMPVGYRVATDTARLQTLLNDNGVGQGVLTLKDEGGVLTLGTDQAYVDAIAGGAGDTLGASDLFTRAVANSDKASSTLFVDVSTLEQYYLPEIPDEQARNSLEQLAAVGISSVNEGKGDSTITVRFVADEK